MCFKIDNYVIKHNKERMDLQDLAQLGTAEKESQGQMLNASVESLTGGVQAQFEALF